MATLDFIARIPLFAGLPQEQLLELSRIVITRSYAKGQMIFSEGEEADGFYVLATGRVKIFKLSWEGKEQILHIFEPGEPFGEVPVFFGGGKFPAHAEALERGEALFFPKDAFESVVRKDPTIALKMLAVLSHRLKQFAKLIEDLSLKEVPQRLAAHLLYLGKQGADLSGQVELDISKAQLASLLGTIPETLSRILNKMTAQGLIEVQGRRIKLVNSRALEEIESGGRLLA
jgi:CRP/FNR family transcriptional regulator, dissimilatory nitrate respiration regulator